MKFTYWILILFTAVAVSAGTDDIMGTWKTVSRVTSPWTGKLSYEPTFEFKGDGNNLTGMLRMDGWPGDAPISDGKIEGDKVTFSVTHQRDYRFGRNGQMYSHFPRIKATGRIHGNEMELTVVPVTSDPDGNEGDGRPFEMKETKIL